jgi:quercetin dioxygenase-like cupin family protein
VRLAEAAPVLVSRPRVVAAGARAEAYLSAFTPRPPMLDRDIEVVALRLGRGGAIDEHSADEPILVLALAGAGRTRVGGADGAWCAFSAGQAMLWPAGALHALEAGDDGLEVRFVHLGREA